MNLQKIIAIIFCLVIIFLAASCASQQDERFDVEFSSEPSGNLDFEGMSFKYLFDPVMNWAVSASNDSFLGYAYNTNLYDAAVKRVKDVENRYNCKIIVESRSGLHEYVKAPVVSGVYVADVVSGISDMIGDNCRMGLYVGINGLNGIIDVTDKEKWGESPFLETMFFNGELYGLVPAAWPELTQLNFGYPVVFNSTIFATNGLTDPREYVESKSWDWGKFEETVNAAHVQEGGTVKHYGFMAASGVLTEMFMFSNGSTVVSLDSDGNPYFSMYDQRAARAMDECIYFYKTACKEAISRTALQYNHDEIAKGFCREEASMAAIYTGYIYGRDAIVAQEIYDFGILPWPHGPDVADDFVFGVIENIYSAFAMPLTTHEPTYTAVILNDIYEPLDGYETRDVVREYMTHNYFFDKRDADVFFAMYDNCTYNYFHWFNAGELNRYLGKGSSVEFISSNNDSMNECFEQYALQIVESMISIYDTYNGYDE